MAERVKMIVIVTVVTALVWLFAEGESLTTRTEAVRVQFVVSEANRGLLRVRVADSFEGAATLELTGSQVGIEAARRALGTVVELRPAEMSFPLVDGVYQVDLASVLANSDRLAGLGVKVTAATPPRVAVEYARLETIDVPVRPVISGLSITGDPIVEPAQATVRVPASLSPSTREAISVLATVPESQLAGVAEGVQTSRSVALTLDEFSRQLRDVELVSNGRATVQFTVESTAAEADLASVPVWIVVPPSVSEQWSVELASNQTVVRVTIRGPRDAVSRISSSETPLIAVVSLDASEMLNRVGTKEISWFIRRDGQLSPLPRGVEVLSAERTTVNLTITERVAP